MFPRSCRRASNLKGARGAPPQRLEKGMMIIRCLSGVGVNCFGANKRDDVVGISGWRND
jgi:hypothetical protein